MGTGKTIGQAGETGLSNEEIIRLDRL